LLLGFHTKQLTERGGDQAPFEFALASRSLLGVDVRFYVPADAGWIVPAVQRRFEEHFDVVYYRSTREIRCDALYVHKRGYPGQVAPGVPQLNHAWDTARHRHGHRFAVTADWVARTARHALRLPGRTLSVPRLRRPPVVPDIVSLPDVDGDLRAELGIPEDAVVFGRHGGLGTFDIGFVMDAVRVVVRERPELWFVLINVEPFDDHPRIVHVPPIVDRGEVRRFVNTADYMLHARSYGEGFGLAVAEFAMVGAPVLTYLGSPCLAQLELLHPGNLLGYRTSDEVLALLRTLPRRTEPVPSDIRERFSPETVMPQFERVFLR